LRLTIFYCFLFILPRCTHLNTPAPISDHQACSPQQILLEIEAGKDVPAGLKGIARIKVESPDKKFSVKEIVIAKRPRCLRLETLSPLGRPEFYAVTDGSDLFLFSPSENKFYRGTASPEHVSLFIPLALSLEEMVSILMGKVPLIDYDAEQVECEDGGGFWIVSLAAKDGRSKQVLKISMQNKKVVETETYGQGGVLIFSGEFGNYQKIGETLVPGEIIVSMPRDKTRVTVRYKNIELFSEIDPDEFRLTPPQGVEVVPLE
jgi:outer membrane lipoprotein-sorting protein